MIDDYTIYISNLNTLNILLNNGCPLNVNDYGEIIYPTVEQIQNWLLDKYNILITIGEKFNGDYNYYAYAYIRSDIAHSVVAYGNNYKNVLLEVIEKAIRHYVGSEE